jgi:CO/xanthine dehydrogenase Mo-binding subunit
MMNYDALRAEQALLREKGVYRGIGIAPFVEITNPGAAFYGVGGARISAQDGAIVKLTPAGDVQCMISVTEQGQGTETIIAQVVADQLGVEPDRVKVITGDTDTTPSGGATWACRGAGIGGETALRAGASCATRSSLSPARSCKPMPPGSLFRTVVSLMPRPGRPGCRWQKSVASPPTARTPCPLASTIR